MCVACATAGVTRALSTGDVTGSDGMHETGARIWIQFGASPHSCCHGGTTDFHFWKINILFCFGSILVKDLSLTPFLIRSFAVKVRIE